MDTKFTKTLKAFFIILSFLAANILIDALTGALVPILIINFIAGADGQPIDYMIYALLAGQVVKAICLYFFIKRRKRSDKYQGAYIKNEALEKPLSFVCIGLGTVGFGLMLTNFLMKVLEGTAILESAKELMQNAFNAQGAVQGIVLLLVVVVGAPLVEELLFRGVLYEELENIVSTKSTIILTALIFGLYHFNILQTPNTIIMGLVLAYVYHKTKSIKAPIIIHATNNLLATIPIIDQVLTPLGFIIDIVFLLIGIYCLKTLRQKA